MSSPKLNFAPDEAPTLKASSKPVPLTWEFDPTVGMDAPFHHLASLFGQEIIMDMDEIVLDTPRQAAVRATRIFQHYSSRIGQQDQTREVMAHLAQGIKDADTDILDEDALLPPEAVFRGMRPRG